jgi:hypothetical protein
MSIVKIKFLGIHLVVGLIIVSSVGWAATSPIPPKENPATRMSSMEQEIKDLKTENTIQEKTLQSVDRFQQQIISERQNHQQFVEGMFSTFINYILGILTVAGILFVILSYFFGNNFKEHFRERFEECVAEAKKKALEQLDHFKSEVDRYSDIVKKEREYLNQRITVLHDKGHNLSQEIELLRKAGYSVKNIQLGEIDLYIANLNDTDVLVISADERADLVRIFELVNAKVNLSAKKIPIAIYVKGRNDSLNKLLDQYPLALSANMPLTLINSIYTISKIKSLLGS